MTAEHSSLDRPGAEAGDGNAFGALVEEHQVIFASVLSGFYPAGGMDWDDLRQVALIGFWQATRDFDPDGDISFTAFSRLCVKREVIDELRSANRAKHGPLTNYVCIDEPFPGQGESAPFRETLSDPAFYSPEGSLLFKEYIDAVAKAGLSPIESDVYMLVNSGHSYEEIAELLGERVKTVDNAMRRASAKVSERTGPSLTNQPSSRR